MDKTVVKSASRLEPQPDDSLDETREQVNGFTTLDNASYPANHPNNHNHIRYNGLSQQTMQQPPPSLDENDVVELFRSATDAARQETQRPVADAGGTNGNLRPGLTIDLGHKQIQRIPDEVIDIIKDEIERLALPYNQIGRFPFKLAECGRLRYLNVRNNELRSFPRPICKLLSLEILDLSRNRIDVLPDNIANLTSLKVLSIQKNKLEKLPVCLGHITTLQVLKLEGNPLVFPPPEVLQVQEKEIGHIVKDSERDTLITTQVKKFLRQKASSSKSGHDSGGDSSSEGHVETPRPTKRSGGGGRFPVKPSISSIEPLTGIVPASSKPPPIPTRSHNRVQSQQHAVPRRPGVAPLAMANERNRSNSEGLLQAATRSKRMGIITRKTSDLGTVDEARTNRFSHYRGFSHGSALRDKPINNARNGGNSSSSPVSPAEAERHRAASFVHRLSSLPEHKRKSLSPDPLVEGAKGLLYALFQVHPHIQSLLALSREGPSKRSSLERVFYNASSHVGELDRELHRFDTFEEEDESQIRSNKGVEHACLTCIKAYEHVGTLLLSNANRLVQQGDQRYVRTLLLLVFGGLVEIRNASYSLRSRIKSRRLPLQTARRLQHRNLSISPAPARPGVGNRMRSGTVIQHAIMPSSSSAMPMPLRLGSNSRSNTLTSTVPGTPRSGETFSGMGTPISMSRSNTMQSPGDLAEEQLFEKIFLKLVGGCDAVLQALPTIKYQFVRCFEVARARGAAPEIRDSWADLCYKCNVTLQNTEALKARLSTIKFREPGVRSQRDLWQLAHAWLKTFVDLAIGVKEAKSYELVPNDIIQLLRNPQKLLKEVGSLINNSPWGELGVQSMASQQQPVYGPPLTQSIIQQVGIHGSPQVSQLNLNSSPGSSSTNVSNGPPTGLVMPPSLSATQYVTPMPATPLSAALGPAAQATVPSSMAASAALGNAGFFSGNVFERADSLLSTMQSRR
ncbi:MAG: hypothetical protein M1819_006570 [Sarea resinae]|nr:MAG: hypothetical protein M1819_006570 [Sarea resinae]